MTVEEEKAAVMAELALFKSAIVAADNLGQLKAALANFVDLALREIPKQ